MVKCFKKIHVAKYLSCTQNMDSSSAVTLLRYDIPKTDAECKKKIREEFKRHAHITDIRIIDQLIIRDQMELQEVVNIWKHKRQLMTYWKEMMERNATDFLLKFFRDHE